MKRPSPSLKGPVAEAKTIHKYVDDYPEERYKALGVVLERPSPFLKGPVAEAKTIHNTGSSSPVLVNAMKGRKIFQQTLAQ
ncbi:15171_t:CDS:2 [Funneliformis caledonium]|uniref:15171_t:CDS:1 n=1 Tax=Funneliformis caledonium TaxID=1117310 RepID=A0A9N9BFB6_9GLOM|nr:15171_t:CDS:2 [Funneliformis caledonium]